MDHELTAKWHELDKVRVGLKDVVVLRPDLSPIQRQIGDLADLTTEAKENLVAAINEVALTGGAGSMNLRVADGYIQYSTDSFSTWTNLIAVADLKGADGSQGPKGEPGAKGEPGEKGDTGAQGVKGDTGPAGPAGAPGKDGAKGDPGTPGKDGVSPTVSTAATTGGTKVTITDAKGSHEFVVKDGAKGADGSNGKDGTNGKDGADGKPGAAGADGVTPHIGDNGNWYLGATDTGKPSRGATGAKGDVGATGPAGPVGPKGDPGTPGAAGAPGKDGAGMDITGATVGQIAKITAVNASGVPTAWEPVDMPSGGSGGAPIKITLGPGDVATSPATFDEIKAALEAGKAPILASTLGKAHWFALNWQLNSSNNLSIQYGTFDIDGGGTANFGIYHITVSSNGINYDIREFTA